MRAGSLQIMHKIKAILQHIKANYWPLIKSLQTGLLLATGLAGFMSGRCPIMGWQIMLGVSGSLTQHDLPTHNGAASAHESRQTGCQQQPSLQTLYQGPVISLYMLKDCFNLVHNL